MSLLVLYPWLSPLNYGFCLIFERVLSRVGDNLFLHTERLGLHACPYYYHDMVSQAICFHTRMQYNRQWILFSPKPFLFPLSYCCQQSKLRLAQSCKRAQTCPKCAQSQQERQESDLKSRRSFVKCQNQTGYDTVFSQKFTGVESFFKKIFCEGNFRFLTNKVM